MLFADGTADASLGAWMQNLFFLLGTVCAVIVAIVHVYAIARKRDPAPDSEYVTRGEMMREIGRIDVDLKDLKTYMQTRTHDLGNKLHAINLKIVWLMGLVAQLCKKADIAVPTEPQINSMDEA